MAQTSINLYATKHALVSSDYPATVYSNWREGHSVANDEYAYLHTTASGNFKEFSFFGYEAFPDNLKYNRLYSMAIRYRYSCGPTASQTSTGINQSGKMGASIALGTFNPSSLTWSNRPGVSEYWFLGSKPTGPADVKDRDLGIQNVTSAEQNSDAVKQFLKYRTLQGYCATSGSYTRHVEIHTKMANGGEPYVIIYYDATETIGSQVYVVSGPKSGYVDPRSAVSFSWDYQPETSQYKCFADTWTQDNAKLKWNAGSGWNEISINDGTKNVTVPANTFPTGSDVQWYIQGTDAAGKTTTSSQYTFTTADAMVVTTPVYPVNVVVDGSETIRFQWTYVSPYGTQPTAFRIKYRQGSTYTTLATVDGTTTYYDCDPDTLPSGTVYWNVTGANSDGIYNSSSIDVAFVNYLAPKVSGLAVTDVPFATVTWSGLDQNAYEIMADGKKYGPYFGTEKIFDLPDYLEDGTHEIGVRILGGVGLWSEWEKLNVTIVNVPGEPISLSALVDEEARLAWDTEEETRDYLVYRNGVQIARTRNEVFTDRYYNGEVEYYVINKLPDGNYSKSNVIERTIKVDVPTIALLDGGEWLKIKFNIKDSSDPVYTDSMTVSYNRFYGNTFQSITTSDFLDTTIEFSAVFLYTQDAERKRFEQMFGKRVIVKFPDGWYGVCVIDSWQRVPNKKYYTAYTFTLRRVEWEDFIDDTA